VECEDDGPGVLPESRDRIFEYGFTTRPGGRGYGLARSREILGHYGGSLALVEGAEGRHSRFVVVLRRAEARRPR
jgi:Signal transduction histidine kinase regulating citrate/malate metabolism